MFKTLYLIWHSKELRFKIGFTLLGIFIFRLFAHIPIPGADVAAIEGIMERNQLLGIFSAMTGGGIEQMSVVLMGIGPYITASIIMQLLVVVVPRLEAISKEGEGGRRVINKYTRILTVPFSFLQSFAMINLLDRMNPTDTPIIADKSVFSMISIMLIITTGTLFLMWLGEVITEKGIGNGISIMIFASIVAAIPTMLGPTLSLAQQDMSYLWPLIGILVFTLILTLVIVVITEGQRQIPITYAGRQMQSRGVASSYIPIRVNQAGMIPIIFAVALISFPALIGNFFQNAKTDWLRDVANFLMTQFNSANMLYIIVYFLLVFGFSFFYVNVTFNPVQVAENIQKRGGFIPGTRPGKQTSEYLRSVSNRITLLGASFLGIVAILPIVVQQFSTRFQANVPMLVSGAGLIIIVGVVLEIVRQINAQLIMQDYDKLY